MEFSVKKMRIWILRLFGLKVDVLIEENKCENYKRISLSKR
ncbi:hypothetical protein Hanom_Chr01g00027281 [Helianthus anomalus]